MNEIITYREMCDREGMNSLQRGMNFRLRSGHSIMLMSRRHNAPYRDRVEEDGRIIVYEGHDAPRTPLNPEPKKADQPEFNPSGSLTQNGLFYRAAVQFKVGEADPELVRVYEKIWTACGPTTEYFIW
jgi:hypothetical protein